MTQYHAAIDYRAGLEPKDSLKGCSCEWLNIDLKTWQKKRIVTKTKTRGKNCDNKQTKGIFQSMFHNLNYKLYVMLCSCNLKSFCKFQAFHNYPNGEGKFGLWKKKFFRVFDVSNKTIPPCVCQSLPVFENQTKHSFSCSIYYFSVFQNQMKHSFSCLTHCFSVFGYHIKHFCACNNFSVCLVYHYSFVRYISSSWVDLMKF